MYELLRRLKRYFLLIPMFFCITMLASQELAEQEPECCCICLVTVLKEGHAIIFHQNIGRDGEDDTASSPHVACIACMNNCLQMPEALCPLCKDPIDFSSIAHQARALDATQLTDDELASIQSLSLADHIDYQMTKPQSKYYLLYAAYCTLGVCVVIYGGLRFMISSNICPARWFR